MDEEMLAAKERIWRRVRARIMASSGVCAKCRVPLDDHRWSEEGSVKSGGQVPVCPVAGPMKEAV